MVVLGVGPHEGGLWAVLGVGRCYSWLGVRWAVLLAGWPTSPAGVFADADGDVLGFGVVGDADSEGAAGDATHVDVSGDVYGEDVAGDAPGDVVSESGVGGAPCVGAAGDVDGEGAAADALLHGLSCGALMVRVLLVMVLGVGPRMGGRQRFWAWPSPLVAEGLMGVGGRLARRSWRCWTPVVSGQLLANPGAAVQGGAGVVDVRGVCSCRCCTGRCRGLGCYR